MHQSLALLPIYNLYYNTCSPRSVFELFIAVTSKKATNEVGMYLCKDISLAQHQTLISKSIENHIRYTSFRVGTSTLREILVEILKFVTKHRNF